MRNELYDVVLATAIFARRSFDCLTLRCDVFASLRLQHIKLLCQSLHDTIQNKDDLIIVDNLEELKIGNCYIQKVL